MNDFNISSFIVIEKDILMDKSLTATDKILYGWISVLSNNKKNKCFASTKYLAHVMDMSGRQVIRCLRKLERSNYITIKILNNNKRVIKTRVSEFIDRRALNNDIEQNDYDWMMEEE